MKNSYNFPKIVAEGCCNHMGDFELAKEMTKTAKICGADYIKWQKRNPVESVPEAWHNRPHPCPVNAYGETYLKHREALEFSIDQHRELKELSDDLGIGYSVSVWDTTSLREIISINPSFIKIPSAANNNQDLIQSTLDQYDGEVHISTGMLGLQEKIELLHSLQPYKERVVVYHTTTEYPCPFEKLFLLEIDNIKKYWPTVGYSGHNYGIAVDMAAIALGVTWIERHFTLDRTSKGTDHAASLEPEGLRRLCRDSKAVVKALQGKGSEATDGEKEQRKKLSINNE